MGSGVLREFAKCFVDGRDQRRIEHTVEDLVSQRVLAVGVGYEDINDHDRLRFDPLLALAVGKADPTGQDRLRESDRGAALAGKSTLNRLELALPGQQAGHRYHKISYIPEAIDRFFVEMFLDAFEQPPEQIVPISTPLTILCTALRKAVSFTATTAATATCRCTSSAVSTCCARA